MLFLDDKVTSGEEATTKGKGIVTMLTEINNAVKETFLKFEGADNVFEKLTEKLTKMENSTIGFMRSMGGVFNLLERSNDPAKRLNDTIGVFQERFMNASKNVQDFGASSKDVVETMEGLADAMGRAVFPSQVTMENMVALSKATGLSNKEIGAMVEKLTSLGGTQEEATKSIHDMAVAARRVGLDATKFVKTMSESVDKVGGFGFKEGIKSLTRMNQQAQMLKTTFGAMVGNLQDSVLSPEGAIEAAAKFQMLGGAVGKLADPFQLLYMAQSDLEGLNKELTNSAKSAFAFNTETGEFKASVQDMYRLKEQASITGAKFEDLVKAGREASKLDYIKKNFDLGNLSEEIQQLLSGLAQVGKGGKVTIDVPGFGVVTEEMVRSGKADEILKDYQEKAALDEKQIAIKQLTTTEKQARDTEIIKNSVLYSLVGADAQKREEILKTLTDSQETYNAAIKDLSKDVGEVIGGETSGLVTKATNKAIKELNNATGYGPNPDATKQKDTKEDVRSAVKNLTTMPDGIIPSNNSAPLILSKGALYKGIAGDDVAMGVGLGDAISKATSGNVGGTIDININLNGSISGDNNLITNMFKKPEVQKEIMDTVLYKLNQFKRQQGVIS